MFFQPKFAILIGYQTVSSISFAVASSVVYTFFFCFDHSSPILSENTEGCVGMRFSTFFHQSTMRATGSILRAQLRKPNSKIF